LNERRWKDGILESAKTFGANEEKWLWGEVSVIRYCENFKIIQKISPN